MAASQVVLYFDRQEDAVQFTLAASSVIADGAPLRETALKVAKEVCKATRITTEGSVDPEGAKLPDGSRPAMLACAPNDGVLIPAATQD